MKNRIDYYTIAKSGMQKMLSMENYLTKDTDLSATLIELVKIRVSQINGCAYCIDIHASEARKLGETEQRIYLLSAWKETDLYNDREKMALEIAESLTLIYNHSFDEKMYSKALSHFTEKELIDLILLVNQVNSWNRLSLSMANQVTKK